MRRLDNLKEEDKEKFARSTSFQRGVLEDELASIKEELIFRPQEQLSELRGRARVLLELLKLLERA